MQGEETVQRMVGGRYRLLETLGRGGMGTVWRAVDELLRREVAVKHVALPVGLDGKDRDSTRQRVIREAQAAARLSHPACVTVFDVVEDDGNVHIVMELVEAPTLAERVERDGPVDVEGATQVGLALVDALDAAHRKGIVHRDVKPSNVMLPATGAVKLADFGIASVKDHPSLTSTGQVVGSPSYMAPEQALGRPSGPETDWWGLGATLYYAIEGRPPFERPGALPTLTAVVEDDPDPAPRAGRLAPVLARLLAKDPTDRPAASELRALLRQHGTAARSDPAPTSRLDPEDRTIEVAPPPPPSRPSPPPTPTDAPTRPQRARPPQPPAEAPAPVRRPASGSRGLVLATLVLALMAVAGVLAWRAADGNDLPGSGDTAASSDTPTTAAKAGGEGTDDGEAGADVPGDWATYTDPKVGYRIAHPPGWQVRQLDGTRTDITDPSTGSYLRVDWTSTPGPSPEGAWQSLSQSFGSRHDAYEELRIEPTTYKGFDAAVWEYAYSDGGARLHAVNLGMVTGTHGFALNFQTQESRWESSQDLFEQFKDSFQVPS